MGCNCKTKNSNSQTLVLKQNAVPNTDSCDYTAEVAAQWLSLLRCVNSKGLLAEFNIQKALYNSFLGVLLSIQNNTSVVCLFKSQLDVIQPYILNIVNQEISC